MHISNVYIVDLHIDMYRYAQAHIGIIQIHKSFAFVFQYIKIQNSKYAGVGKYIDKPMPHKTNV